MRLLPSLLFLSLAACPSYQYLNVDVTSAGQPVRGAIATAVCGERDGTAARSDAAGAARLELPASQRRRPCAITVARAGHDTARFETDRVCDHPDCMAIEVELDGGAR